MAIKRVVSTDFWTDNKVVDMFSPEDKLFMLYLLTNPHASLLGIYPLSARIAAFEIGYSVEAIKVLLERFERKYGIISYSNATQEVAVLNWLKHSVMKGGKPVMDCLENDIKNVKDKNLLATVLENLQSEESLNLTVKAFVDKYVGIYSTNNIDSTNNMDMVMDMDMEYRPRIVPRIVDESSNIIKSTRHKYGSYKNVLLSDEQLKKLKTEFPSDWEKWIEKVSEYVAIKGKGYNDYLAVIRNWARKDKKGEGQQNELRKRATGILPKPEKGSFSECRNLI